MGPAPIQFLLQPPEGLGKPAPDQVHTMSLDPPPPAASWQLKLPVLLQGELPAQGLLSSDTDVSCLSIETFYKLAEAGELFPNKPSLREVNKLAPRELNSVHLQVHICE